MGVYHSHPYSPPLPSDADIAAIADENLFQLIVSLEQSKPRFKLWRIEPGSVVPVDLVFDTEPANSIDRSLSSGQRAAIVAAAVVSVLLLLTISLSLLPPAPALTPAP